MWAGTSTPPEQAYTPTACKDQEIYNIFNTEKILKRPPLVAVDSHSGTAGIAYWINSYFSLKEDERIDKKDPLVLAIKEKIDVEYESGRTASIGDEELLNLIHDIDSKRFKKLMLGMAK